MWECLHLILSYYWGSASTPGSLYHLREIISRHQVDKKGKTFNISDEFIHHCFKANLIANICNQLKINLHIQQILHENSKVWLEKISKQLLENSIMPTMSADPLYMMHRSFLYTAFLYLDFREAIRYEEGEHIIRLWKFWLPPFIGCKCNNYAVETVNLLANLKADFPKHISYLATHNRIVNVDGRAGHGKLIDQMVEHYNL